MRQLLILAALVTSAACAQSPVVTVLRNNNALYQKNLLQSVEKWHEGWLDWRPTAEVRSFRQQVIHLLETNSEGCAALLGEKNPFADESVVKAMVSKASLIEGVKQSAELCTRAYASLADADLAKRVAFFGREQTAALPALLTQVHTALHYGNLATYMRLRGVVPPSSESAAPAKAAETEMVTFYMTFLRKGPKWSPEQTEETRRIQEQHLAHIRQSAESGRLRLAGPFTDDGDIRGILIYQVASIAEANAIAEADPAVRAGRLTVETHPWMVEKGYLP